MVVVGLTGGIGSGKTTVTNQLAKLGVAIIDADVVSRQAIQDSEVVVKIAENIGAEFVVNNRVDRTLLREAVFKDDGVRVELESILHPIVLDDILQQIDKLELQSHDFCILSVPLLLEKQRLRKLCSKIIVVDCEQQQQIERTCSRDKVTTSQVKSAMSVQLSRRQRLKQADFVVANVGTIAQLQQQVSHLFNSLHKMIV